MGQGISLQAEGEAGNKMKSYTHKYSRTNAATIIFYQRRVHVRIFMNTKPIENHPAWSDID